MENNTYIVYVAYDVSGTCLYVGEGKPDRWRHIISGTSHVYEANRWHFKNKNPVVKVLHEGLTKEDSRRIEYELIQELKPLWNKAHGNGAMLSQFTTFAVEKFREFMKKSGKRRQNIDDSLQKIKDLCKLLNSRGEATIPRSFKWSDTKIISGYMSRLSSGNPMYYEQMQYIFTFTQDKENKTYTITLKDWVNKD